MPESFMTNRERLITMPDVFFILNIISSGKSFKPAFLSTKYDRRRFKAMATERGQAGIYTQNQKKRFPLTTCGNDTALH
jgi:hypothetical protein